MNAIYSRRSIRKYKSTPVEEAQIKQVIRAASYAPSAGNERPWHFIVIQNRETLNAFPTFHPFTQMLKEAPVAIVTCADTSAVKYDGMFWIQDMSAAIQNLMLEAENIGLGTCWCGLYPNADFVSRVKEMLSLPEHVIPTAVVALGYPDEAREVPERFIEERVHFEKW